MKKLSFIAVFMAALTIIGFSATGCSDKKPAAVADSANTDTLVADTQAMDSTEALIEETPMPKAADELFDDFIFNLSLIHISEPTRLQRSSRMPSSA